LRIMPRTTVVSVIAIALLGTLCATRAAAECGSLAAQRPGKSQFGPASFLLMPNNDHESDEGIVGFWKVKFLAKDNSDIPDDTVIDTGFAQWHGDGTEIMNSSRPPATSNFCLGVWRKTGRSNYKLNHFALSSDLDGKLIGPANIREEVILDQSGDAYRGVFTIDQYDLSGNLLAHITGEIVAARITVDTTVEDVL
jgi:hypothetical protein